LGADILLRRFLTRCIGIRDFSNKARREFWKRIRIGRRFFRIFHFIAGCPKTKREKSKNSIISFII